MQPNQWQQPNLYNSSFQQLSFPGAPQQNMNPSYLPSQGTGFPGQQQPMQTGFGQQQQQQRQPQSVFPSQQTGGGNLAFLNQPPPSSFRPMASGVMPQMTGYPGGGASGIMSQSTGFQGGMMSQPTGMGMLGGGGGGLMSQPTGMGMGLRAQPTGVQDPRLQSMMQSFMPSNLSQVRLPCYPVAFTADAIAALRSFRCTAIQLYPSKSASRSDLPIPPPESVGQDAKSPVDAVSPREEGLRPDLPGVGKG